MSSDILSVLVCLVITLLVSFPLAGALKRRPWAFYLAAALVTAAYLWYRQAGAYVPGVQFLVDTMQKGYLASFFLMIVMLTGTLDEGSAARRTLQPVRAELSIISLILAIGHVVAFLPAYLPHLSRVVTTHSYVAVSLVLALVLTALYALLTLLSLRVFRRRMPYRTWKGIQRLSYLMVALLYLHILLTVGHSAITGKTGDAKAAIVVYTLVGLAYLVLRVRKALRDRRRRAAGDPQGAREVGEPSDAGGYPSEAEGRR
jgi:DMSO/TMAO reductase YedYZ heme-binding membrane subunit